ncbi:MAG: 6-pyruvoyl tetrahydropterin synthase family protein [Thermoproteota archaeon]
MKFRVCVRLGFSAAHRVTGHSGLGSRMHGHDFQAKLCAESQSLDDRGISHDLVVLEEALKSVLADLDYSVLNDVLGDENVTLEKLALHIIQKAAAKVPAACCVEVCVAGGRHCAEVRT